MKKLKVLLLCTRNSARSRMAEESLRQFAADCFEVESAGFARRRGQRPWSIPWCWRFWPSWA